MITTGILVLVALVVYRAGWARGRYLAKKPLLQYYTVCSCEHGNNVHHQGGKGGCAFTNQKATLFCQCLKFTPKAIQ